MYEKISKIRGEHFWLIVTSLVILAIVALGFVLYFARTVLIPFVLAIFVVSIVSPILDFQVLKLRFPRVLAVGITLIIVLIVIIVVCILVISAVQTVVGKAAEYTDNFIGLVSSGFDELDSLGVKLERDKILQDLRNQVPKLFTNMFGTVMGFFSSFLFVAIFVIFLLAGRNPYIIRKGVYADIDHDVRRYITTKLAVSAATGLFVWVALSIMKLPLAAVFGILAFLLNFIPSIGSIVATLLPIPIAVAHYGNPMMVVLAVLLPGSVQMTIGNVIEPKIMGSGLHLHPVTVLLALSFWGLLWGIPGMFLAVPVTAVIRIVLLQFDTLKPLGLVLSGHLPGSDVHSYEEEEEDA